MTQTRLLDSIVDIHGVPTLHSNRFFCVPKIKELMHKNNP